MEFNYDLPEDTTSTPKVSSILSAFSTAEVVIDPTSVKVEKGTDSPFITYRLVGSEENEEISQPDFIGAFAKNRARVSDCAPLWISDKFNNWETVKTFLQKICISIKGDDSLVLAFLNTLATNKITDPQEIASEVSEFIIHNLADAPFVAVLGGILNTGKDGKDYLGSTFSPIRGYNVFCLSKDSTDEERESALNNRINGEITFNMNGNRPENLGFMTRMFKDDRQDRSTELRPYIISKGFDLAYNITVFGAIPGVEMPTDNAPTENESGEAPTTPTTTDTDDDLPF